MTTRTAPAFPPGHPKLSFRRPEGVRRQFKRGDLALLVCSPCPTGVSSIVVICRSDSQFPAATLPVRDRLGAYADAPAKSLCLLAGVDTQEFGPGFQDLLKFIDDATAAEE